MKHAVGAFLLVLQVTRTASRLSPLSAQWRQVVVEVGTRTYEISLIEVFFDQPAYLNGLTPLPDFRNHTAARDLVSLSCRVGDDKIDTLPIPPGHDIFVVPMAPREQTDPPWLGSLNRLFPDLYYPYNRLSLALPLHICSQYKSGKPSPHCTLEFPDQAEVFLATAQGNRFFGEVELNSVLDKNNKKLVDEQPADIFGSSFAEIGAPGPAEATLQNMIQRTTPLVAANLRNFVMGDLLSKVITDNIGGAPDFPGALPAGFTTAAFIEEGTEERSGAGVGKLTKQTTDLVVKLVEMGVVRDLTQFWTQEIGASMHDYLATAFVTYTKQEVPDILIANLTKALNESVRTSLSAKIASKCLKPIAEKIKVELTHRMTRSVTRNLAHSLTHTLRGHRDSESCLQCNYNSASSDVDCAGCSHLNTHEENIQAFERLDWNAAMNAEHFLESGLLKAAKKT